MPDKLTDSEIIKALECCLETSGVNCGKCPYCDNCVTDENTSLMMTDVLDLINRLQAENERLKKENHWFADIGKLYSEIKAEAYKEFAELLRLSIVNKPSEFKASQATVDFLNGATHRQHEILDEINIVLKELGYKE